MRSTSYHLSHVVSRSIEAICLSAAPALPEIDACRVAAKDVSLFVRRQIGKQGLRGYKPAFIAAREIDDRPIASPDQPLRPETENDVIHGLAQIIGVPL